MAAVDMPFVSHRMQRLQSERGVVMTLFWVQTPEGAHHLAASGFDGRGSGHFQYCSTPEIFQVIPPELGIQEMRATNRGDVIEWLALMGARMLSPNTQDPLPDVDLLTLPGGQPGENVAKRRGSKAATGGFGEIKPGKRRKSTPASAEGGQSDKLSDRLSDRQRTQPSGQANGPGKSASLLARPSAESLAAFESDASLKAWIMESPDGATIEAFTTYAQQLSGPIKDSEDEPGSLPPRRQQLTSQQALQILDQIASYGRASLQLLEASNISPCIGRLRRPPTPAAVAQKANDIAQLWHSTASATLAHAKTYMQTSATS